MRKIAIINQKGGVGKTTTAVNLSAALAELGRPTLLADLDPQAHATLHLGVDPRTLSASTYDVLVKEAPLASALLPFGPCLWLAPSSIDLAGAEIELASVLGREVVLRDRLAAGPRDLDFILFDCPPSLGLLTVNALVAADEVLITVQPHFLALQGLSRLLDTIVLVQRRINPAIRVTGVVLCLFEANTTLAREVEGEIATFLSSDAHAGLPWHSATLFRTHIRRNIKLAEAPSHGKTIFQYAPGCHGAEDYAALARELLGIEEPIQSTPSEAPSPGEEHVGPPEEAPAETEDQAPVPPEERARPAEEVPVQAPPQDLGPPVEPAEPTGPNA